MDLDLFNGNLLIVFNFFEQKLIMINVLKITPDLFNKTKINYCNKQVNLISVASVINVDSRTIVITPYELSYLKDIYNSLLSLHLNISFVIFNNTIKASLPILTKELRVVFTKQVKNEEELFKINLRQLRRKWLQKVEDSVKLKVISIDEGRFFSNEIQKRIDVYNKKAFELVKQKINLLSNS